MVGGCNDGRERVVPLQGLVREQLRYEALPGCAPPDDAFVAVHIRWAAVMACA